MDKVALQDVKLESPSGNGDTLSRELDNIQTGAISSEICGVCTNTATYFQDIFVAPSRKIGEAGNMRFYQIFPRFHLLKVFPRARLGRRVPQVARPFVPIFLNILYCGHL